MPLYTMIYHCIPLYNQKAHSGVVQATVFSCSGKGALRASRCSGQSNLDMCGSMMYLKGQLDFLTRPQVQIGSFFF